MRKSSSHLLSLGLLAAMLLSFFPVGVATASAPVPPSPAEVLPDWWANQPVQQDTTAEIEPLVLETLATEGTADFFIWMEEKADLSPAYELETKEEKGQFVYETLVATAERTQADLRAYLDRQGVDYRPFYIANKILVRGGNMELLTAVAERSDVGRITANHQYQLQEPFRSPDVVEHTLAVETNISFVNADDVWALGVTGSNIVLAGNDTGLDWDHPALIEQYRGWDGSSADHNYNWWDATSTYPNVPGDGHGHGTHTSGTMVGDDGVGNQVGMAPAAELLHCKNMTDSGGGSDATFTECFEWDLAPWDLSGANPRPDLAPDAVNNSWGYSGGNAPQFEDEIAALQAAGILIEVSAGNEGSSCSTLRSPGDYHQVLTTGSVQHSSGVMPGTITGFSSRGPSDLYPGEYMPDVMAPGENIRSSVPGGGFQGGWSGTSMSGPHVTGLIALMWSASPALRGQVTPTIDIIIDTAVPLTGQNGSNCGGDYTDGPNNDWGYGTIDALAAVEMAIALGGSGALEGTVTDSSDSSPIEDVTITAVHAEGYDWNTDTDPSGYYTMTVASGTYTVTATHPQYETASIFGIVVATDTVTTQDFSLVPRGRLFGYVTDYDNGFPLEATIVVSGAGFVETNPATGYYEMYLDAGSYDLTAIADDYVAETATVSISSGGDTQQDFALMAEVTFIPAPVEVTVGWGNTHSEPMTITNRMTDTYAFEFLELPGGFVPTLLGEPGVLAAWPGPDGFGYTGEDVTYQWVDIAATGTPVALSDDDYDGPFSIGFTFNLYGTDYTDFYVSSNGHIDFGAGSSDLGNDCPLPNSNAPNNIIAPMWDDLNPNSTGALVYYESFAACPVGPGSCLVVQYENFYHYGGAHAGTFEAIMYDNGSVLMQFEDAGDEEGSGSTTAIEGNNSGGDHGLTYACDTASSLADNTAVCFVYPGSAGCEAAEIPWIGQNPVSGTVPGQTSLNGWLNFTATQSAGIDQPGDYYMTLVVNGDPQLRVPVTMTVTPGGSQGKLEGTVTSMGYCDSNYFPLEEAEVFIEGAGGYTYTLWTDASGHYQRWLDADTYSVTVSYPEHPTTTVSVDVVAASTTTQDFLLRWQQPCVDTVPDSLSTVVDMGMSDTLTIDIYNDGAVPLDFELAEKDRGFMPAIAGVLPPATPRERLAGYDPNAMTTEGHLAPSSQPAYQSGILAAGDVLAQWPTGLALPWGTGFSGDEGTVWFSNPSAAGGDDLNHEFDVDGTATGRTVDPTTSASWYGDIAYNPNTGMFWQVNVGGDNCIFEWDPAGGLTGNTICGSDWTGTSQRGLAYDPETDTYYVGGWNSDVVYHIDNTGAVLEQWSFTGGISGLAYNFADGLLFIQENSTNDTISVLDVATGTIIDTFTVPGFGSYQGAGLAIDCDGNLWTPHQGDGDAYLVDSGVPANLCTSDVPWLFETPVTGTIPADGGMTTIDVTMDSAFVDQPGEYYASLVVKSNDPVNDSYAVPVTMTVNALGNWGRMDGWVYGMGYCDVSTPTVMADATIFVEDSSGMTWTIDSDAGYYLHWFEAGTYTVTAEAPDHVAETDVVQVTGGTTTTHDFDLRWMHPCASAMPDSLEMTIVLGDQQSTPLVLVNDGAADMSFVMKEISTTAPTMLSFGQPDISIPRFEGELEPDTAPPSIERAPNAPTLGEVSATGPLFTLQGAPAFAVDVYPGEDLVTFDSDAPGSWTVVGDLTGSAYFGGDFLQGDFSTLYAVDYYANELHAIDTATGAVTVIGPATPSSGENWSGMTGSNDGTLYASSSACGTNSTLYTVDPATGATTVIGQMRSGSCMIDIAINASGEMYGVDIVDDSLYSIDTNTGVATLVGSLGVGANYAQGMDFEEESNVLYWAAYTSAGELRIIDTDTGNSTLVGGFPGGAEVDSIAFATGGGSTDIPWLSEDPITGTVPADSVRSVDIIFTAFPTLTQWATFPVFTGTLVAQTSDSYAGDGGKMYIPVTMTISGEPFCSFETNSPVNVGDTVYFTNTTLGDPPLSFEWAFGDGTGSTMVSPTHVYDESGMYTAWLTATNPLGTDVCSGTIQVSGPPNASFVSNTPIELGEVAYFTDTSTGYPPISIWFWNFGANAVPSTSNDQDPGPVMFTAEGTYTVTLSVSSGGGGDTYQAPFEVLPDVCTPITGVDLTQVTMDPVYAGESVTFHANIMPNNAEKPYTYTIDFGMGASAPALSSDDPLSLTHTYASTGTYDVVVAVWNCDMTVPMTDTVQVTVMEPGTCEEVSGVDLMQVTSGPIYTDTLVTFSADIMPDNAIKPYTYTIDFGMGASAPALSSDDPLSLTHTYAMTGTYDVEIAVWNCDMTVPVTDTLQVNVWEYGEAAYLYLPIVLKNH